MPLTVTFNPAVYGGTPYGSGNKLCDVLSSIAFGPDTLVFPPGGGGLSVEGLNVIDIDPKTGKSAVLPAEQFNAEYWITVTTAADQLRAVLTYAKFGTITATYTARPDRLDIALVVANTSTRYWVCSKSIKVLGMPVGPKDHRGFSTGTDPDVVTLEAPFAVAVVQPDATARKWFGLFAGRLMICDGRPPYFNDNALPSPAVPTHPDGSVRNLSNVRGAVGPGESESTTISLRFGPKGTPPAALASDYVASYRSAHPPRPNWPDRRPIGAIFFGDNGRIVSTYKAAAEKPTDWNAGAFRVAVLKFASDCAFGAVNADMQGVIVWDFERPIDQHAEFVGSPRQAVDRCPAWGVVGPTGLTLAQEFVKVFTSAGLRFGMTVRGQDYKLDNSYINPVLPDFDAVYTPGDPYPQAVSIVFDKIMDVIRMGGTLVYLDSAGPLLTVADPTYFAEIARRFPDVLIIPEMSSEAASAVSARYVETRRGEFGLVDGLVRAIYPESFAAVQAFAVDGKYDFTKTPDRLKHAVAAGNVPLVKPYERTQTQAIRAIYAGLGGQRR